MFADQVVTTEQAFQELQVGIKIGRLPVCNMISGLAKKVRDDHIFNENELSPTLHFSESGFPNNP